MGKDASPYQPPDAAVVGRVANVPDKSRAARWGNYFEYGSSSASFSAIDSYVTKRLSMWLSWKHSQRHWAWQRWQSLIRKIPLVRLGRTVPWMSA